MAIDLQEWRSAAEQLLYLTSLHVIYLYIPESLLWLSAMVTIMLLTSLTYLEMINGKTLSEQSKVNLMLKKYIYPKL